MSKTSIKQLKRNYVWRHNSYIGQTTWAIKALQGMAGGITLTDSARQQLSKTLYELEKLRKELAVRKDQIQHEPKETLK